MSVVDYNQQAEEHGGVLLLVQQVGSLLSAKHFQRLYERLSTVRQLRVKNQNRSVRLRYKKFYPTENNEWGEFQAHRIVFGMICFASCKEPSELNELYKIYESMKNAYGTTLFDSRLVVFGLDQNDCSKDNIANDLLKQDNSQLISPRSKTKKPKTKLQLDPSLLMKEAMGVESPPDVAEQNAMHESKSNMTDVVATHLITDTQAPTTNGALVQGRDVSNGRTLQEQGDGDSQISKTVVNTTPTKPAVPKKPDHLKSTKPETTRLENLKEEEVEEKPSIEEVTDADDSTTKSDRSESMTSQSSDSSTSSFSREAPPYVIFFQDPDNCPGLEAKMHDYVSSLFWVLESKRLDRSQERLEKIPMLSAPFERPDLHNVDTDSRIYKKRCQGRLKKHLADLCLLSGLPGEAMLHYQVAMETLKACNDFLWLGAAQEGLCCCHVLVARASVQSVPSGSSLQRNHSFTVAEGVAAAASKDAVAKARQGLLKKTINSLEKSERVTRLTEDIGERYREAAAYYSRYRQAAVIETECNIKACRVLASQQKYLEASGFLQNLVYINLTLNDEEKTLRYNTLSSLYADIQMARKSAFYKRIAAMQCVGPSLPRPAWAQCYYLLLQALDGYRILLDPKERLHNPNSGWPATQLRVLHELIYSARKMGNPATAIRHITYLLHTMLNHLSESERAELVRILQTYTPHCEGSSHTLALDNGLLLPPVPFYRFPTVTEFRPECPAEKTRAFKVKKAASLLSTQSSPFIYSPLMRTKAATAKTPRMDFVWQEGEACYITIHVYNPLPIPLEVQSLTLLTEGVSLDMADLKFSVPGRSESQQLIKAVPTSAGLLKIFGYQTLVLGCRSTCRFRDITSQLELPHFEVEVVPRLPVVGAALRCGNQHVVQGTSEAEDWALLTELQLCAGQSCECSLVLRNTSDIPIEHFQLTSQSSSQSESATRAVTWQLENLRSQLPVRAQSEAVLTLYLQGVLAEGEQREEEQKFSTTLLVEYSGGAGLEENYCRHCNVTLSITIKPVLLVHDAYVIPSFSADSCVLRMSVENSSHHAVRLRCPFLVQQQQDCVLSSRAVQRLAFIIPRYNAVTLPPTPTTKTTDDSSIESQTTVSSPPSIQVSQSEHSVNALASHVIDYVQGLSGVTWSFVDQSTEGRVPFTGHKGVEERWTRFLTPPISIDISLDGQVYPTNDDVIESLLHVPVSLCCKLTNVFDCDIVDISVKFTAGTADDLETVRFLGLSSFNIPGLQLGETHSIETGVLFLSPGRHVLRLYCDLEVKSRGQRATEKAMFMSLLSTENLHRRSLCLPNLNILAKEPPNAF